MFTTCRDTEKVNYFFFVSDHFTTLQSFEYYFDKKAQALPGRKHFVFAMLSTPRHSPKNNTFGPRSRYRKKLHAAAANQITQNKKISLDIHK